MMRLLRNMVIFMAAISLPLWAVGYLTATRTEAYRTATRVLQHSPVVRARIGEPKYQRLALFDGISYSTAGTDAEASFRLHVRGSEASAVVDLRLARRLGEWMLMEGNRIDEEGGVHPLLSTISNTIPGPAPP